MAAGGKRTYVDIILNVDRDGVETPIAIHLPDGRLFRVDSVTSRDRSRPARAFRIMIGEHATTVWKEESPCRSPRWYVLMR